MGRGLGIALVWALVAAVTAPIVAEIPPQAQVRALEEEPPSLPRYLTEEEKRLPFPSVPREDFLFRAPPTGTVRCPAEYEPAQGLLIAWESYTSILTEMTVAITTQDPEAIVYVVVDNASEQTTASNSLSSAGADMSQVQFIVRTTDTVWIRDYGPRFIFEDGSRAIIDHTYNRPRPNDDAFNDYLSTLWGEPQYDIPLVHGGGNFHLFSNGDAFMSNLILTENPGLTEQDVKDLYREYQNLDLTIYPGFPTSFDSTQHIDMWMFPVGDDKIIIGQYSSSTGQPYTITENAVTDLTARGYTVYRTPGWNSGGTHYTYTNAVIINDLVFISKFGGSYPSQDATALSVFQTSLPGKTIQQIDSSGIISAAGALHCIVMHVPAYTTTLRVTPSTDLSASGPVGGPFTPNSITYTLENTSDAAIDYSVTKTVPWLSLTNASGSIGAHASVPVTVSINPAANSLGSGVHEDTLNFINTTDHSGDTTRTVSLQVGAPAPVYTFPLDTSPGWTTQGQWAFGHPTGQGGASYGNPDPSNGYTGSNVYGVNLNGDYSTTPGGPYHLTAGPFSLTDYQQVSLKFQRWLNTDYQPYAYATVAVSNNGTSWTTVWQNGGSEIADPSWSLQSFDLSSVADDQPTVYIRWSYQIGSGAWAYSGWNIDDIEIWGIETAPPPATLVGAKSWKTHGSGGSAEEFSIDLPIAPPYPAPGMPGVETRSGGLTKLTFAFDRAVTLPPNPTDAARLYGVTNPGPYVPLSATLVNGGTTLVTTWSGIPNVDRYVVCLNLPGLAGDRDVEVIGQMGNVQLTPPATLAYTNGYDKTTIGSYLGQAATPANCKFDITQTPPPSAKMIDGYDKAALSGSFSGPVSATPATCP